MDDLDIHSTKLNRRLVGLVVKASTARAEDPGFDSHLISFKLGLLLIISSWL